VQDILGRRRDSVMVHSASVRDWNIGALEAEPRNIGSLEKGGGAVAAAPSAPHLASDGLPEPLAWSGRFAGGLIAGMAAAAPSLTACSHIAHVLAYLASLYGHTTCMLLASTLTHVVRLLRRRSLLRSHVRRCPPTPCTPFAEATHTALAVELTRGLLCGPACGHQAPRALLL